MADGEEEVGDLAAEDLRAVVRIGLERGAFLLTAGEVVVARRILGLGEAAAAVFARLTSRVPTVFEVATLQVPGVDVPAALDELDRVGLVDGLVPWRARAERLTVDRLREVAARLGLATSGGPKAAWVARVGAARGWSESRWIRVRHRELLRRLERWAFLRRHPDRRTLVVERLGHVVWPRYALTSGPGPHVDRRALLRWERLVDRPLDPDEAIEALRRGDGRAAGRLDLGHRLAAALADHARAAERETPEAAVATYDALAACGQPADPVRHARALELARRPHDALALLRAALERTTGPERLAIHRSGRRLARSLGAGWAPDPPLRAPARRVLRLPGADPAGGRPHYRVADAEAAVEGAVVAWLATAGRRALHVESSLWTTILALLLADEVLFLPIPGALPTRFLAGPLDLGTPAFATRRRAHLDRLLAAVRAGEAPGRLADAYPRWRGVRLAGARWDLDSPDLVAVAQGLGGPALAALIGILLDRGWAAARGLPDLVVLPGPAIRLPDAVPSSLGPGLHLIELKGPGDAVRDEQTQWFHDLGSLGAPIALWEVRKLPGTG